MTRGGGGGDSRAYEACVRFCTSKQVLIEAEASPQFEQCTTCYICSRIYPLVILAMVVLESEQFVSVK